MPENMILGWISVTQPDKSLTIFGQVFEKKLTNFWLFLTIFGQFFDEFQKEATASFWIQIWKWWQLWFGLSNWDKISWFKPG